MPRTLRAKDWFHPDGFPLAVERREPQEPFGLHGHDFSEVVVVTGGRGTHRIGREAWPLSAGDVFVVKGQEAHEYANLDELNLINVLYRPERLKWDLVDLVVPARLPRPVHPRAAVAAAAPVQQPAPPAAGRDRPRPSG